MIDLSSYIFQSRDIVLKPYLNAVVIGHGSSGKSTVSGRLVYECDGIDEDLMTKFEREANQVQIVLFKKKDQFDYSNMNK